MYNTVPGLKDQAGEHPDTSYQRTLTGMRNTGTPHVCPCHTHRPQAPHERACVHVLTGTGKSLTHEHKDHPPPTGSYYRTEQGSSPFLKYEYARVNTAPDADKDRKAGSLPLYQRCATQLRLFLTCETDEDAEPARVWARGQA